MFGYIKNILKNRSLKKAAVYAEKRKKTAYNFETAKTMGVIYPFNINIDTVLNAVKDIAKRYDIELVFLIYFPQNRLPEGIGKNSPSRIFFSDNECNWFGKPTAAMVKSFVNTRFNILLDLSSKTWFPLQYTVISSNADFKVGRINCEQCNPYNFTLLGSKNEEQFVIDLETYLYKIK
jgi:hypothetical protein